MLREYDAGTHVTYFLAEILDIEHLFGNTQMVQRVIKVSSESHPPQ